MQWAPVVAHVLGSVADSVQSWWRHQMERFSALLAICAGNSPVPGEFPSQRPVTRSFDVFFDLRLNKRLNKQSWGWWFETLSSPFWRHSNVHRYCSDIRDIVSILIFWLFDGNNNLSMSPWMSVPVYLTFLRAETELIWFNMVNVVVADALAPCVDRTSAPMILTI